MNRRVAILGLVVAAMMGALILFVCVNMHRGVYQSWCARIALNDPSAACRQGVAYSALNAFQEQIMDSPVPLPVFYGFTMRLDTMRDGISSTSFNIRPFILIELSGSIPKADWLSAHDKSLSSTGVDAARAFLRSEVDIYNASVTDPVRRLSYADDGPISTHDMWVSDIFPLVFGAFWGITLMLTIIAFRPIRRV